MTTGDELEAQGWRVDTSPASTAKVVLSGRFEPSLAERVLTEHEQTGKPVSQILRDRVAESYAVEDRTDDEPITLRPSEVVRFLRTRGKPAA